MSSLTLNTSLQKRLPLNSVFIRKMTMSNVLEYEL